MSKLKKYRLRDKMTYLFLIKTFLAGDLMYTLLTTTLAVGLSEDHRPSNRFLANRIAESIF